MNRSLTISAANFPAHFYEVGNSGYLRKLHSIYSAQGANSIASPTSEYVGIPAPDEGLDYV